MKTLPSLISWFREPAIIPIPSDNTNRHHQKLMAKEFTELTVTIWNEEQRFYNNIFDDETEFLSAYKTLIKRASGLKPKYFAINPNYFNDFILA